MDDTPKHPAEAGSFVSQPVTGRPDLIVDGGDLPATARELRDVLRGSGCIFDRGVPVKVVPLADGSPPMAMELTSDQVVIDAHRLRRPVKFNRDGGLVPTTLPERVARLYLGMAGEWYLPPLAGITTAPLLSQDGSVRMPDGYDPVTGLWCSGAPSFQLPEAPTRAEAEAAMALIRGAFRTFPFADAARKFEPPLGVEVVDLEQPPGCDESAFLVGLVTAVARASLWLAPGLLVVAPSISGSGAGKGLLVGAISEIAFGIRPRAFTAGSEKQELDKRLAAELVEAGPVLFLDNVNGVMLRSDTLASVMTERPTRVRLLGQTRMVPLNSTAFIAITGNGLTISEDLARRFVVCELDAQCENPESRPFAPDFLSQVRARRGELLGAALTIWRWGRQNSAEIARGRPLGGFESWAGLVRDPLVALGCADPVERIDTVKANDPQRRRVAELFETWWSVHGDSPVRAADLGEAVQAIADPQRKGRQYLATYLGKLAGTRAAGFVLTRQEAVGKWGAATYALQRTGSEAGDGMGHRDHREDRSGPVACSTPMPPMTPMPDETDELEITEVAAGGELVL
jgi:hypothetical protein